jgi:ribonuclease HII
VLPGLEAEGPVCGVDEAGRGPWAGPVVAAAVVLDLSRVPPGLADSKVLSASARERAHDAILRDAAAYGVGVATVAEIDALNILQATFLAMRRAVAALAAVPVLALVDGDRDPGLGVPTRTIVKGDALVPAISAASILAKTVRDRTMRALHGLHPQYGWARNMGYGTAGHAAALVRHGASAEHRRSFKPVSNILCSGARGTQAIPR